MKNFALNQRVKGTICGILAAICYGTNPLGALSLKSEGVNMTTVLAHRFGLAALILLLIMGVKKESFRISRKAFRILLSLGVLFAISSLSLFYSFMYMDAGVASTMLFVYPVMVALIMILFFKERPSLKTWLSIGLALVGILLLYRGNGHTTLNGTGVLLVMVSSLSYAIYIVIQERARLQLSPIQTNLYVIAICFACIVIQSFCSPASHLQWLSTGREWFFALFLAIVPAILALVLLTVSCRNIGSTPTAIMGALEPLTAVIIGIGMFGEQFTLRLAFGIALILTAVVLIALSKETESGHEKSAASKSK